MLHLFDKKYKTVKIMKYDYYLTAVFYVNIC